MNIEYGPVMTGLYSQLRPLYKVKLMNIESYIQWFDIEAAKILNCWEVKEANGLVGLRLNTDRYRVLLDSISDPRFREPINNMEATCDWDGKQVCTQYPNTKPYYEDDPAYLFFLPYTSVAMAAFHLTLDKIVQAVLSPEQLELYEKQETQIMLQKESIPDDSKVVRVLCAFNWLRATLSRQLNQVNFTTVPDSEKDFVLPNVQYIYIIGHHILQVAPNTLHLGYVDHNGWSEEQQRPHQSQTHLIIGLLELKRSAVCSLLGEILQELPDDWLTSPQFLSQMGNWYGHEWSIMTINNP